VGRDGYALKTPRRTLPLLAVAAAVAAAAAVVAWPGGAGRGCVSTLPAVVVSSPSAPRWAALLRASGVSVRVGTLADGLARCGLVVPADAAATGARVAAFVRRGGHAVVASRTVLAALGIDTQPAGGLDSVVAHGLSGEAAWPASETVEPLAHAGTALAWNGDSVVLSRAKVGRGTVLALGVDPFAGALQGYELLPTLGAEAAADLGANGPRRDAAEFYFDPGTIKLDPQQAAARFAGARAVFVAGWNYGYLDYPYAQLISALHARGIRAYAWLEPPMVNLTLWNEHPECREKTQSGADARVDWRSLIALEDPRCFELAWQIWRGLLTSYDWDGVDVAELYFEAANGRTDRMTPFHPSALRAFGHDPATDPQGFLAWRTMEVTRLNRELATRIHTLDPRLDVELTVIDDELDPAEGGGVGSDVHALAQVARDVGGSLQVEDPFTTWTLGPARYATLSAKVTPLLPAGSAFFDLNVVPRLGGRPTAQMTGGELALSLANAAARSGRVAVYTTSELPDSDLANIPAALAGAAATGDGTITAPWTVTIASPRHGWDRLLFDGRPWPVADGVALVPGGSHRIAWLPGATGDPALTRLDAELIAASAGARVLRATYTTAATAWAVVDRKPVSLRVDGTAANVTPAQDPAGGWTIRLPAGRHAVVLGF